MSSIITSEIASFRAHRRKTLIGFADIVIKAGDASIIRIKDCPIHEKDGERWVGLPARPWQNKNDQAQWVPVIEFPDQDVWNGVQNAVLQSLDEFIDGVRS